MTTEQVKQNRDKAQAAVDALRKAVESGVVWNAEFEDLKSRLGGAVWRDTEAFIWPAMRNGVDEAFKYPVSPSSVHDVRSFSKKIEPGRAKGIAVPASVDEFLAFWVPVVALFDQAKPLIKKGRRPSDDPTKAPPRTLEHTGTCPVCGRNIKIDDAGRMVAHGYQIAHSFRHGNCFGVGFEPWEVSPTGAVKFVAQVRANIEGVTDSLQGAYDGRLSKVYDQRRNRFVKRGEARFDALLLGRVRQLEYEVRSLASLAHRFDEKLAAWAPATLPGVIAGFER